MVHFDSFTREAYCSGFFACLLKLNHVALIVLRAILSPGLRVTADRLSQISPNKLSQSLSFSLLILFILFINLIRLLIYY